MSYQTRLTRTLSGFGAAVMLVVLLASPALQAQTVPLYETFELEMTKSGVSGNKFTKFASVTFTKGGRSFDVEGFYDGGDTWRARFMPDEEGTWDYTWSLEGSNGSGSFDCTARANPDNHGHARRDPAHTRYMVYDDGTAHYWYGGKWFNAHNYGPPSKGGEVNQGPGEDTRYSDAVFTDCLDEMASRGHNGLLIQIALYPLENDKLSWDLTWIQRCEWLVEQMASRGIYCQLNLFNTWSRHKDYWFVYTTDANDHVFNVWASGDETAKENYLRTLVARFAGYYNIYWELGNEMEHSPNPGSTFITLANSYYIPWIQQYDPYGLPIGVSEDYIHENTNVQIGFLHQTGSLPPSSGSSRIYIMNELVSGWSGGVLAYDSVIRNSANRLGYRRTFWRMFTYGGTGSSEATWLDIMNPLNSAVLTVMDDQHRLRSLVEGLPTHINEMDTDTGFVSSGPGTYRTRRKYGECYVIYFLLDPGQSTGAGTVTVSLPTGDYQVQWYDPKTGSTVSQESISASGSTALSHPSFTEDIVLVITADASGSPVAVIDAQPTGGDAPLTVGFDASGSYDPNGTIVHYEWDFENDGSPDANGVIAGHVYTESGQHTAKLTVTDNDGLTDSTTVPITVGGGAVSLTNLNRYELVNFVSDSSQGTSVTVENAGFEQPGSLAWRRMDTVPGWTGVSSIPPMETGVCRDEYSPPHWGEYAAFTHNGHADGGGDVESFYQTSNHAILADTTYTVHVWAWAKYGEWGCLPKAILYYQDGGSRVELASHYENVLNSSWTPYEFSWTSGASGDYIGKSLGVEFTATGGFAHYVHFDDVSVSYECDGPSGTSTYYGDRDYIITSMPSYLEGVQGIRTANDDKDQTSETWITFDIDRNADIYIAYDQRATSLPNWMSGYAAIGESIATTDPGGGFDLYKKAYTAGGVVLGANMAPGAAGAESNYIVLLVGTSVPPPTITQHPQSLELWPGETAAFSVTAAGEGTLTYQWQKDGADLSDGGKISGATSDTLQITGVDAGDAGDYRCVVGNEGGDTTSNGAALTVVTLRTLTLTETNENWGEVEIVPEPNDANNMQYPEGTEVVLTAVPAEEREFGHWESFDPNFPNDANHATTDANLTTTVVLDMDQHVNAVWKCGSGAGPLLPLIVFGVGLFVTWRRRS